MCLNRVCDFRSGFALHRCAFKMDDGDEDVYDFGDIMPEESPEVAEDDDAAAAAADGEDNGKSQTARKSGAKGKGKRGGKSAKAKAEKAAEAKEKGKRRAGVQVKAEKVGDQKCTGACKRKQPTENFYNDQTVCKECCLAKKRWGRLCESQEQGEWWDGMKATNGKQADKSLRTFMKHLKEKPKDKFSIMDHRRRLKKSSGVRGAHRKKWMWKNEYIEKMGETAHGNLSSKEALDSWNAMLKAPGVRTDNKGPRGELRMKMSLGDYESSFSEVADEEEYEASAPTKKKATEKDFLKAGDSLLNHGSHSMFMAANSDSDDPGHRDFHSTLQEKTGSSIMTSSTAIDVRELVGGGEVVPCGRKSRQKDQEEDAEADSHDAEADEPPSKRQKEDEKEDRTATGAEEVDEEWLDYHVSLLKEARKLTGSFTSLQTNLRMQIEQADAVIMEFSTENNKLQ